MSRRPKQALLPFGRKERARNNGTRLGRPRKEGAGVSHRARPVLAAHTAVHVTLRMADHVGNLRSRRRFACVRAAFTRFCFGDGWRLVHFAVLGNHIHLIVEADSAAALSLGMRKIAHSISRRLNAASPRWLGRVFADRYHAHVLRTPTEMANAVRYVLNNAARHFGIASHAHASLSASPPGARFHIDAFSSAAPNAPHTPPLGYLLARAASMRP